MQTVADGIWVGRICYSTLCLPLHSAGLFTVASVCSAFDFLAAGLCAVQHSLVYVPGPCPILLLLFCGPGPPGRTLSTTLSCICLVASLCSPHLGGCIFPMAMFLPTSISGFFTSCVSQSRQCVHALFLVRLLATLHDKVLVRHACCAVLCCAGLLVVCAGASHAYGRPWQAVAA